MAHVLFGVTIGLSPKKKFFWDPLMSRIDNRLTNWKCANLNMAGRAVLLIATIDSLSSCWFNLFMIPNGVCQKIEVVFSLG